MDGGAFGKKIIIVSEDAKTDLLKKLIRQWPEIERAVTVLPGRGYKHVLKKDEALELRASLGNKFKVLVHRDRDSLTDAEVADLKSSYADDGVRLWMTDQSDIEAEFCSPQFVSSLTGMALDKCDDAVSQIVSTQQSTIKDMFAAQRTSHNEEMYKAGGSPLNDVVWSSFQQRPLMGAKGKFVFNQLKGKIPSNAFSEVKALGHVGFPEMAISLKQVLEEMMA